MIIEFKKDTEFKKVTDLLETEGLKFARLTQNNIWVQSKIDRKIIFNLLIEKNINAIIIL